MRPTSHSDLLDFSYQWYWIVTDRVGELDDLLRRPLRRVELVRAQTRAYLDALQSIPDDASDQLVSNAFGAMLGRLDAGGEDVDRLYGWTRALVPELGPARDTASALQVWQATLDRWARGQRDPARHLDENVLARLATSYHDAAYAPANAFRKRRRASEEEWLTDPRRRTAWDGYLWDCYFGEAYHDPLVYAVGHSTMLAREWWRANSGTLTAEQKEGLLSEHLDSLQAYGDPETMDWSLVRPLDEAAALDRVPPFDSVANAPRMG